MLVLGRSENYFTNDAKGRLHNKVILIVGKESVTAKARKYDYVNYAK